MGVDPNIGSQMNKKELIKTFIMISNWNKPFGLHGFYKNKSAVKGKSVEWRRKRLNDAWGGKQPLKGKVEMFKGNVKALKVHGEALKGDG